MAQLDRFGKALLPEECHESPVHLQGDRATGSSSDGPREVAEAGPDLHRRVVRLKPDHLDDSAGQLRGAQEVLASSPRRRETASGQEFPDRATAPRV
jgi:hypothetical protein